MVCALGAAPASGACSPMAAVAVDGLRGDTASPDRALVQTRLPDSGQSWRAAHFRRPLDPEPNDWVADCPFGQRTLRQGLPHHSSSRRTCTPTMAWPIPAAVRLGRQPGGGASRVRMRMDHRANLRLPAEAPDPDRGPRRNGEPQHGLGLDQQLVLQWQQQAGNAAVTHLLLGGGRAAAVQRRLRGRRPAGRTNPELDDAWVARLVDPVVPSRSAQDEGHPQLQRQDGKGGKRSRITQGPGARGQTGSPPTKRSGCARRA